MDSNGRRKFRNPIRPLVRKALEKTVFKQYRERIERFNWNARLLKTLSEFPGIPLFPTRAELCAHVSRSQISDGQMPIDYLEFGVFEGASLQRWCGLNKNVQSRFFGFDSFEGLPEDWIDGWPKGTFNTGGKPPDINDPRVQFIVGWFQNSLPPFLTSFAPKNQLVIHNDCDLYSSTLYCLTTMNRFLLPGTIIMFDDFNDPIHEYRALTDYCAAYQRSFRIIAATDRFFQVVVELR